MYVIAEIKLSKTYHLSHILQKDLSTCVHVMGEKYMLPRVITYS